MNGLEVTTVKKPLENNSNSDDLTNVISEVSTENDSSTYSGLMETLFEEQSKPIDLLGQMVEENPLSSEEFSRRGFFSSESWTRTESFHSRIVEIADEFVTCECVIDKESREFELRVFGKYLFAHLQDLKIDDFIMIQVKAREGATRMDVYDGKKLVDKELFNLQDLYDGSEDSALNKPFKL